MNIFYLDSDPVQCAEWMVNSHVVKMILETAQLLSTTHRVLDGNQQTIIKNGRKKKVWILNDNRNGFIYQATHINHPSAVWVREAVENYNWLFDHLIALCDEYEYRYEKKHKVVREGITLFLSSPPHNLREWEWTTPPSAMDKSYIISEDPITNYRNYYKHGKTHLHVWKKRQPPKWIS